MDLYGGIALNDISQTKEDKCHMISLICGILKTNKAETDSENISRQQTGG